MTRLVFETTDGIYTIVLPHNHMTIYSVVDDLVRPLLLAAGYAPESVREALPDCDECDICDRCDKDDEDDEEVE